jgi:flavodoxin
MNAVVVYDSVFGNTAAVAKAIARGLEGGATVLLLRAADARPEHLSGADLLVVGSPTRGFRPTPDVANLIRSIPAKELTGTRGAAFDTRLDLAYVEPSAVRLLVKTGGYAAKRISAGLQKAGATLVAPPEGFLVQGTEGPLGQGEEARAEAWAAALLEDTPDG